MQSLGIINLKYLIKSNYLITLKNYPIFINFVIVGIFNNFIFEIIYFFYPHLFHKKYHSQKLNINHFLNCFQKKF